MLAPASATFATEQLGEGLWAELQPLMANHWHEMAYYDDLMLNPDRERYEALQRTGGLRLFTARGAMGSLIGYLAVSVAGSLHFRPLIEASQHALYIDPLCRGTRAGVELIEYAHARLKAEGVSVLYQMSKVGQAINIGPMLMRYFDYEHVENVYAIRLDRET